MSNSTNLLDLGRDNTKEYGEHVIQQRSLVDKRDALKPVARRIIWAMGPGKGNLNLRPGTPFKKCARIVGDCFVAGTKVSTPNGPINIEDLRIGDIVNTSQGPKKVIDLIGNKNAFMYTLSLSNGNKIITTKNQEVKVKIGNKFFWKKVSELTSSDEIVCEH